MNEMEYVVRFLEALIIVGGVMILIAQRMQRDRKVPIDDAPVRPVLRRRSTPRMRVVHRGGSRVPYRGGPR